VTLKVVRWRKRAEQFLPGSKRGKGEREEAGAGWRNSPNNVCTYE
jgi:hypothetical protein